MSTESKAKEALAELRSRWRAAAAASELDRYMSFFTEDAVLIPAGQPPLAGLEAIRSFAQRFFNSYRIASEEMITDEVVVTGDWAFERGPYRSTYEPLSDGAPIVDTGYALYVMKLDPDGSWRYARIIWNG